MSPTPDSVPRNIVQCSIQLPQTSDTLVYSVSKTSSQQPAVMRSVHGAALLPSVPPVLIFLSFITFHVIPFLAYITFSGFISSVANDLKLRRVLRTPPPLLSLRKEVCQVLYSDIVLIEIDFKK